MSLTLLRAFHRVATAGSFTRAAEAAGVSQPTLSAQVRLLEETHEASLFDRKGRGVALTPLGQKLFDVTARLFAAEEDATALLEGARKLKGGHLRVAADSAGHVMPALAELRRRHPGLTFSLQVDNSTAVLQRLLDYDADVAVTARQTSDPRFHTMLIRRDRLVLFAPRGHDLARRRSVKLAELAGRDLVIRERGSVTREVFEARLAEAGIKPGALLEVQSREAVREAVVAGFGLGIVFDSEFADDGTCRALPVSDADLDVAEYIACLETRRRLPLVRGFLDVAASASGKAPVS